MYTTIELGWGRTLVSNVHDYMNKKACHGIREISACSISAMFRCAQLFMDFATSRQLLRGSFEQACEELVDH
jgi:hypothetical protein